MKDRLDRGLRGRLEMLGREAAVAQTVMAVEVAGVERFAPKRPGGAQVNGDRRPALAQVGGAAGIARALFDGDVAVDDREGQYLHVRVPEGHEQGDGVIGGGVGIDEEATASHRARLYHTFNSP